MWVARLDYQWKVTLGLWALLGTVAVYVQKHRPPEWALISALTIIVAGYSLMWIREMHARNSRQQQMAEYYLYEAERLVSQEQLPQVDRPKSKWQQKPFYKDQIALSQIGATTIFALAVWWFLGVP